MSGDKSLALTAGSYTNAWIRSRIQRQTCEQASVEDSTIITVDHGLDTNPNEFTYIGDNDNGQNDLKIEASRI